jgi:tRNA (cmo5U34)-methyltransferase
LNRPDSRPDRGASRAAERPWIDFDGAYGRDYDHLIRVAIAGYPVMHELGVGAARACCPGAQELLIVGPAWGEEMALWSRAYPMGCFTLVEPSAAMVERCQRRLERLALLERCRLLPCRLEESGLADQGFDVVVAQLVLHLLPPGSQENLAERLARLLRPGGVLPFSGSSRSRDSQGDALLLAAWRERLRLLGVDEPLIHRFADARGREVFAIDPEALTPRLQSQGCSAPLSLYQGAGVRLWCSRRSGGSAGVPAVRPA